MSFSVPTSTSRLSATRKVLQRYLNRYESETYSGSFDYTNSLNRSQNLADSAPYNQGSTILSRSESESAILFSRHSSGSIPDNDLPKPKQASPQIAAVAQEDESGFDDMADIDVHSICELQSKRKCDAVPSVPTPCPQEVSQGAGSVTVLNGNAAVEPMESKPVSRRRARAHAPAITQMDSILSPPTIPPPPPPPPAVMTQPMSLVKSSVDCAKRVDSDQPVQPTQPTQLEFPLDAELTDPPTLPQYSTGRRSAL